MGRTVGQVFCNQWKAVGPVGLVSPDMAGRFGFVVPVNDGGAVTQVRVWSPGCLKQKLQISAMGRGVVVQLAYGDLDEVKVNGFDTIDRSKDFENGGGTGYFQTHRFGTVSMTDNTGVTDIYHYDTNCDLNRDGEVTFGGAGTERDILSSFCYPATGAIVGDSW